MSRRRDEPAPGGSGRVRFVALGIGVVLAIAATGTLVLSDNPRVLRLAVVVALWAFVIGAMAGVRRRPSESAQEQVEQAGPGAALELRRVYQVERERDSAARREYEAQLAAELRRTVDEGLRRHVESLRDEVQSLRSEMMDLLEGELRVERVQFESTRLTGAPRDGRGRAQQSGNIPTIDAEFGRGPGQQALPPGRQGQDAPDLGAHRAAQQHPAPPTPARPPHVSPQQHPSPHPSAPYPSPQGRPPQAPEPAYRVQPPPPPPARPQPSPRPNRPPDPLFDPLPPTALGPSTPFEQTRFGSDTGEFARPDLPPHQPVHRPEQHRQSALEPQPYRPEQHRQPALEPQQYRPEPPRPPARELQPPQQPAAAYRPEQQRRPAQELQPPTLPPQPAGSYRPEQQPYRPEQRSPAQELQPPRLPAPELPARHGQPEPERHDPAAPSYLRGGGGAPWAAQRDQPAQELTPLDLSQPPSGPPSGSPGGYPPPAALPSPAGYPSRPDFLQPAPPVPQPPSRHAVPPSPPSPPPPAHQQGGPQQGAHEQGDAPGGQHRGRHSTPDPGAGQPEPEQGGRRRRYREEGEANDVLNRVLGER